MRHAGCRNPDGEWTNPVLRLNYVPGSVDRESITAVVAFNTLIH